MAKINRDAYYRDVEVVVDELDNQTDRGCAIVGAALLDEKLRMSIEAILDDTLSSRFRTTLLEGPRAPLGTYSARSDLGRALGMFDDLFHNELKLIGRIRNRFAHDLTIRDFHDPAIAPLCAERRGQHVKRIERDGTPIPIVEYRGPADARKVFIVSVQTALHMLFISVSEFGAKGTV